MRVSGSTTRPMGRRESDASPVSAEKNGCAARIPSRRRSVVPEFPASRTPCGSFKPCRPTPVTRREPSACRSTPAPSALMHAAVERQSAASRKFRTCTCPFAMAENITLRCETDLSPGTRIFPVSPLFAGRISFPSAIYIFPSKSCFQISASPARAALQRPAAAPMENAACKLYPPVKPSTSTTSPAR